jgi:DMSO/TMAO reductase YedYZ molybdopterin-dependent catalytic subunit
MHYGQMARQPRQDGWSGPSQAWSWVAGVAAGLCGLAVADLAAWALAPAGSPVFAVGEAAISLMPAGLVNWGKDALGFADKPLLVAAVTAVVLLGGAVAGRLEMVRRHAGIAVYTVLAALALLAVLTRPGAVLLNAVPTVLGLLIGALLLGSSVARIRSWSSAAGHTEEGRPVDARDPYVQVARRGFLSMVAVMGAAGVVGSVAGRALAGAANTVASARSALRLPAAARPAAPVPAAADLGIDGLTPYLTSNADFYRIDTALRVPAIDPSQWSLAITGMVQNPLRMSFADLLARPLEEHLVTLTCVSNPVGGDLAGNAAWLGYPLHRLLAEAAPLAGADMVLSRSHDGFTASTPLSVLTDPDRHSLLAVGMNGEALPVEHGFPVRMVVPGLYGYVSATKWVIELKVTTFAADSAYWTTRGWSAHGPIKLASRIDVPGGRTMSAGYGTVAGVAWAQHVGIQNVEVRIDDGPWQRAELAATAGPDTWRQWRLGWLATPGRHVLTVRARDAHGRLQVDLEQRPAPDGATGLHSVTVDVE